MSADRPNRHLTVNGGNHHGCCWSRCNKRTYTFVAVDEVGRKLAEKTVAATCAGHAEAVMWVRERLGAGGGAIEDCWHLSARLSGSLTAGQQVVRVPRS